jgi:nitrogen regulatory protein PII
MMLVTAIVKPFTLGDVRAALERLGVFGTAGPATLLAGLRAQVHADVVDRNLPIIAVTPGSPTASVRAADLLPN